MFDILLNEKETELKYQTREFVKSIPASWLRKMDRDEIQYPTDYVKRLGKEGLLGVRFPSEYGGKDLGWVAETAAIE